MFIVCPSYCCTSLRSLHFKSVSSSSRDVKSISKPTYLVVSPFDSNISASKLFKCTPTHSHSIDSSTSSFRVVSHRNICPKPKLRNNTSESWGDRGSKRDLFLDKHIGILTYSYFGCGFVNEIFPILVGGWIFLLFLYTRTSYFCCLLVQVLLWSKVTSFSI